MLDTWMTADVLILVLMIRSLPWAAAHMALPLLVLPQPNCRAVCGEPIPTHRWSPWLHYDELLASARKVGKPLDSGA